MITQITIKDFNPNPPSKLAVVGANNYSPKVPKVPYISLDSCFRRNDGKEIVNVHDFSVYKLYNLTEDEIKTVESA